MIYVWGRENCQSCKALKRFFDKKDAEYKYMDIDSDGKHIIDMAKEGGFSALPIVTIKKEDQIQIAFSGFNPEKAANLMSEKSAEDVAPVASEV